MSFSSKRFFQVFVSFRSLYPRVVCSYHSNLQPLSHSLPQAVKFTTIFTAKVWPNFLPLGNNPSVCFVNRSALEVGPRGSSSVIETLSMHPVHIGAPQELIA